MGSTERSSIWQGAIIAIVSSIITAGIGAFVQHRYSGEERRMQLVLDEKQAFVGACEEYLTQYRQWHELMNYQMLKDDPISASYSEFDSIGAALAYRAWKKDFDIAYGRILLLSSNDFGPLTLEVSTVLHNSLRDVSNDTSTSPAEMQQILSDVDTYFFSTWLVRAQHEILQFNTGVRNELPLPQMFEQRRSANRTRVENDSAYEAMYKGLLRAEEYMQRTDSNWRKDGKSRVPTHDEFMEWMRTEER